MARASKTSRSGNCWSGSRANPRKASRCGIHMLDHITIGVSNSEQSKHFYDRALRPLGITRLYTEGEQFTGYGISPKAFFWIGRRDAPQTSAHIAFAARDR